MAVLIYPQVFLLMQQIGYLVMKMVLTVDHPK